MNRTILASALLFLGLAPAFAAAESRADRTEGKHYWFDEWREPAWMNRGYYAAPSWQRHPLLWNSRPLETSNRYQRWGDGWSSRNEGRGWRREHRPCDNYGSGYRRPDRHYRYR